MDDKEEGEIEDGEIPGEVNLSAAPAQPARDADAEARSAPAEAAPSNAVRASDFWRPCCAVQPERASMYLPQLEIWCSNTSLDSATVVAKPKLRPKCLCGWPWSLCHCASACARVAAARRPPAGWRFRQHACQACLHCPAPHIRSARAGQLARAGRALGSLPGPGAGGLAGGNTAVARQAAAVAGTVRGTQALLMRSGAALAKWYPVVHGGAPQTSACRSVATTGLALAVQAVPAAPATVLALIFAKGSTSAVLQATGFLSKTVTRQRPPATPWRRLPRCALTSTGSPRQSASPTQ